MPEATRTVDPAYVDGPANRSMSRAMLLSLIPGAGHAYLGDYSRAAAYSAAPAALVATGYILDRSATDYSYADQNIAYHLAEKTYQLSIATTYLAARHSFRQSRTNGLANAPPSEGRLLLAPFSPTTLSDPWVHFGWILASSATTIEALTRRASRYDDIRTIERADHTFSKSSGTALYGSELVSGSIMTAAAEEAFWRGMVQEELQDSTGRWPGILLASALFGFAHTLPSGTSTEKTDRFLNGTLGGLYLGLLFDKRSHRLAPVVAAHFWYNIAVGTTLFLVDPLNNPLRFQFTLKF
ncbi:MAG: CPBP family intramembrane metalloprotease [Nitrospirae bacterium]|nr:CPBP family intramembrane metalloprotease [Nitrospirota bacterium]